MTLPRFTAAEGTGAGGMSGGAADGRRFRLAEGFQAAPRLCFA